MSLVTFYETDYWLLHQQMRQQNIILSQTYINSSKNIEESLEESNSQKPMISHGQNVKKYNATAI